MYSHQSGSIGEADYFLDSVQMVACLLIGGMGGGGGKAY